MTIEEMLRSTNPRYSLRQIADKHGVSHETVRQIRIKQNIEVKYLDTIYGEAVQLVRDKHLKGMSIAKAEQDIGVPNWIRKKLWVQTEKEKSIHRKNKFFSKTKKVGDCLEWQGTYIGGSTPLFAGTLTERNARAWAVYFATGEYPSEAPKVTCGNHKCVKVEHLKGE